MTGNSLKLRLLLKLILTNKTEFYDRASTLIEVHLDRFRAKPSLSSGARLTTVVDSLGGVLGRDLAPFLAEQAAMEVEKRIWKNLSELNNEAPFELYHNADWSLAQFCYLACRTLSPKVVLETGVAYGITSTVILHALSVNGQGSLHSVDLPPLGRDADDYVGILIPQALRHQWHLHRGASKRVLPALLAQLGTVDVFIHDALHTYWSMKGEFAQVWPYLRPGGILIADDIEQNRAFEEFVQKAKPSFYATIEEENKDAFFGIMIK